MKINIVLGIFILLLVVTTYYFMPVTDIKNIFGNFISSRYNICDLKLKTRNT